MSFLTWGVASFLSITLHRRGVVGIARHMSCGLNVGWGGHIGDYIGFWGAHIVLAPAALPLQLLGLFDPDARGQLHFDPGASKNVDTNDLQISRKCGGSARHVMQIA